MCDHSKNKNCIIIILHIIKCVVSPSARDPTSSKPGLYAFFQVVFNRPPAMVVLQILLFSSLYQYTRFNNLYLNLSSFLYCPCVSLLTGTLIQINILYLQFYLRVIVVVLVMHQVSYEAGLFGSANLHVFFFAFL